ncbi:50S ribosomal protein L17 [Pontibacter sp. 13R65]|uniref:50S ribosomal protein L17 n=1 Tax=Pontibacter sp. 13R65 TaxID=3127458 RepID=UPI00301E2B75
MRHGKKVNHLGRTASHRKAMLSNLAASLIMHKRVSTTVAKAKALRKYVEPLLTKSKSDTTHSRRTVFAYLQDKESVKELFDIVSEKIAARPGGYTRILKTGYRLGDNAEMCVIELVDFNEDMLAATAATAAGAKKTRRRGGKKKGTEGTEAAADATSTPEVESTNDETKSAE